MTEINDKESQKRERVRVKIVRRKRWRGIHRNQQVRVLPEVHNTVRC